MARGGLWRLLWGARVDPWPGRDGPGLLIVARDTRTLGVGTMG